MWPNCWNGDDHRSRTKGLKDDIEVVGIFKLCMFELDLEANLLLSATQMKKKNNGESKRVNIYSRRQWIWMNILPPRWCALGGLADPSIVRMYKFSYFLPNSRESAPPHAMKPTSLA